QAALVAGLNLGLLARQSLSRSTRRPTQIYALHAARDSPSPLGSQPGDETCHVVRLQQPLDGHVLEEDPLLDLALVDAPGARLIGDLLLDRRRANVGGRDHVTGKAVLAALQGGGAGQSDEAVLGANVGRLVRAGGQAVGA